VGCWVTFWRKGDTHNGAKTPTVWVASSSCVSQAEVEIPNGTGAAIRLDTPGWWAWLAASTTLSFAYPIYDRQAGYIRGWMTIRKEKRRRGSHYWVAYRRTGGRLRKIYLGKSGELTQRGLTATAERFLAMDEQTADRQKEVMPGQRSGASLEREAMMRRLKSRHRAGTYWPTMGGTIWPTVVVHSRATIDSL
jgi:hypothetical protein